MTLIQPVNGFRQGHFFIFNSGVSPCKYSVSEVIAYSNISINNMDILEKINEVGPKRMQRNLRQLLYLKLWNYPIMIELNNWK